ncbi:glyoxalase [Aureimonas endophytica]|uniref:Glyoxalase n=1 Tax=Aureimonas endophytica TaxID=2027858 RepID=A0A916ZE06_9HYPH|nr:VOC family protein [Aureimonas endophytica]GGD91018.1 glyoxalase [Aureimonas endophytica]
MSPTLVPELSVTDWRRSTAFYRDLIGFSIRYGREDEGFVYLELGSAELMLDQIGIGRDFETAERLAGPLGVGLNLQIEVPDVAAIAARLDAAGIELALPMEEKWYRTGEREAGQRQLVVADPDGYLVRPVQSLGERAIG